MINQEQGVRSAIGVLLATSVEPDGDPTTVSRILRANLTPNRFSDALCDELATFVPLAFSRAVLSHEDCAIDYPLYYIAATIGATSETRHPLSDNILYNAALSIAFQWEMDDDKLRVASFSGEHQALTNLINDGKARGTKLERASVSPPYVVYSTPPTQTNTLNQKPWWKFW